jgi:hypothetical protein
MVAAPPNEESPFACRPSHLQLLRGAPRSTALMNDHSSGRAAKSRLVLRYHPIPEMGFLHLAFIAFKALSCVPSPPATASFRWRSWALITSSAVFPLSGKSHGPPTCLHVIVLISFASIFVVRSYPCQESCVNWIRLPQVSFTIAMVEPVTLVGCMVNSAPRALMRS